MEKQEKQAIEILHMMCGNNGCVISDSGGKDSSVLKHIALPLLLGGLLLYDKITQEYPQLMGGMNDTEEKENGKE